MEARWVNTVQGKPIASDFTTTNSLGSPICVDATTGLAYILINNNIVPLVDGPINPAWFGLVEGFNWANAPANDAAIAAMKSVLASLSPAVMNVKFPSGTYCFGATIEITEFNWLLEGSSGAGFTNFTTSLNFNFGVPGIRVQNEQSSGFNTKDAAPHSSGSGSTIRDLIIRGRFYDNVTESETHGLQIRGTTNVENVTVQYFEGDGIYASANLGAASGVTPPYGNINMSRFSRVTVNNCRNGVVIAGSDANAMTFIALNSTQNRQWGLDNQSTLGCQFFGGQFDANGTTVYNGAGTIPVTRCSSGGNIYGVIVGQEIGAAANAPSGTTTDNTWWYYISAGGVSQQAPAWANGMSLRAGGCIHNSSLAGPSIYSGIHTENDQNKGQIAEPSLVVGGILATWCFQNNAIGTGGGGARIRAGLDPTSTNAAMVIEPMLTVNSGNVNTSLGWASGNTSNTALDIRHTTLGAHTLVFSTGLGNLLFGRSSGAQIYYQITTTGTTSQFGTGAAFPDAFNPLALIITDNAKSFANGRRVMIDTAAPASGAHGQGEIVFRRTATLSDPFASRCVTLGTPGTWQDIYNGWGTNPIGYVTGKGAGASVTQLTSKSTAVTINNLTGHIIMNNAALAASATASFQVNNTQIAAVDTVVLNLTGGPANTFAYDYQIGAIIAGSFFIAIKNLTAGSLSEALEFNFTIIKGANN